MTCIARWPLDQRAHGISLSALKLLFELACAGLQYPTIRQAADQVAISPSSVSRAAESWSARAGVGGRRPHDGGASVLRVVCAAERRGTVAIAPILTAEQQSANSTARNLNPTPSSSRSRIAASSMAMPRLLGLAPALG